MTYAITVEKAARRLLERFARYVERLRGHDVARKAPGRNLPEDGDDVHGDQTDVHVDVLERGHVADQRCWDAGCLV